MAALLRGYLVSVSAEVLLLQLGEVRTIAAVLGGKVALHFFAVVGPLNRCCHVPLYVGEHLQDALNSLMRPA